MKKFATKFLLGLVAAVGLTVGAHAAGGDSIAWDKAPKKTTDLGSLQKGA